MNTGVVVARRVLFYTRLGRGIKIGLVGFYILSLIATFPKINMMLVLLFAALLIGSSIFLHRWENEAMAELNGLMLEKCDPVAFAQGMDLLNAHYREGSARQLNTRLSGVQARQLMGDHEGARKLLEGLDPAALPAMLRIIFYGLAGRDKLQMGDVSGAMHCRQAILEQRPPDPAGRALADSWQLILQMQILLRENKFSEARTLSNILQPQMKAKMQKATFALSMARLYLGEANARAARGELEYVVANGNRLSCVQEAKDLLARQDKDA